MYTLRQRAWHILIPLLSVKALLCPFKLSALDIIHSCFAHNLMPFKKLKKEEKKCLHGPVFTHIFTISDVISFFLWIQVTLWCHFLSA